MVNVQKVSEAHPVSEVAAKTERLKLNANEFVENITLTSANDAESEYGPFVAINFKDIATGEEMHFVCPTNTTWGRNCIEKFTEVVDGMTRLKPEFKNIPIWVGVSDKTKSAAGRTYMYLLWGRMTADGQREVVESKGE